MQRDECDGPGCKKPPRPNSKYCSRNCGQRRNRVDKREIGSGRTPPELVSEEAERAAQDVLREELRPHVREAITDEVVEQIKAMIGYLPAAIAEAGKLLTNADPELRYKASRLIMQHTAGNRSIVPDINADKQQDLVVHFNLPRPDPVGLVTIEGSLPAQEHRQCDSCLAYKPPDQFEGASDRCTVCFEKMQAIGRGIVTRTASVPD